MYQGKLVSYIIKMLENKSFPQINLLCSTANNLLGIFNSYIQQEPYTSTTATSLYMPLDPVSDNLEDVLDMLLTWEVRMDMSEEQALYN